MLFAHDTEIGLVAAAALVNTLDEDGDALPDVEALARFVEGWGWTGSLRRDTDELHAVQALRPVLRRLWEGDREEVVDAVNRLLADAGALPQLVRHDDWGYHLHATPSDAPLATRMAVEAAMAVVDLVRADALDRLGACAADDCTGVLVDLSKNRSRRYCEAGCGNRAAVAAYRARRAQG